jgi:DNA-binding transcriptional LysR family regulator
LNTDAGVLKIKELLREAALTHPEAEFHFLHSSTIEIVKNISSGMIEAGFIFGTPREEKLELLFLTTVTLVIAAPAIWRDTFEHAPLRDVLALPWVMPPESCPFYGKVNELFHEHALKPVKPVSSDHETTTLQLVQSGIGVSLLPEFMCLEAERRGEIAVWRGGKYTIDLCFAYVPRNRETPGIKLFSELLKAVWPQSIQTKRIK